MIMRSNNYFVNELERINERIADWQQARKELKEDWIKTCCPFQVGDTVKVNGWSYRDKRMVVTRIFIKEGYNGDVEFVGKGHVLKANNEPGKQIGERTHRIDDKEY